MKVGPLDRSDLLAMRRRTPRRDACSAASRHGRPARLHRPADLGDRPGPQRNTIRMTDPLRRRLVSGGAQYPRPKLGSTSGAASRYTWHTRSASAWPARSASRRTNFAAEVSVSG